MPTSTKATDGGRVGGPLVIANCVEVDLVWNIVPTKQVKNVLHARSTGAPTITAAMAQAIYAAIIASAQWTAYKPYVNAGCQLARVDMRDLNTANKPLVSSTGGATSGTGAGLALPPAVAAVISLKTASAGRGFRGRIYLPGLDSTTMNTTTGVFLAAFQTAAQNLITEVETAMTAQGLTHALAQRHRQAYTGRTGTSIADRAANVVDVTSFLMETLVPKSQRRRSYIA